MGKVDDNKKLKMNTLLQTAFDLFTGKGFAKTTVSIYREIETKLIGLKYTLTPLAKTLNYVYQWWPIEPK